ASPTINASTASNAREITMTTLEQIEVPALAAPHAHHAGTHGRLRFVGHFVEMQLAMMVGMMVGGPLGIPAVASTELRATLWLVAMVVPMVAWMRFRGMSWRSNGEMAAAMIVPTLALFPVLWAGLIGATTLISFEHLSMAPAMLALMIFRRRQYGWS
ncbi:MAG TPA: hypothetical protein VIV06_04385, partial [Candidatus Limnocylindrales bacterium]